MAIPILIHHDKLVGSDGRPIRCACVTLPTPWRYPSLNPRIPDRIAAGDIALHMMTREVADANTTAFDLEAPGSHPQAAGRAWTTRCIFGQTRATH